MKDYDESNAVNCIKENVGQMDSIEEQIRIMCKVNRFLKKDFDIEERNMKDKDCEQEYDEEEQLQIMTVDEWKHEIIRYDRMQGRPSAEIVIQGQKIECLLDTGATANVMSWERFEKLKNVELINTVAKLRCANDGYLEVKGEAVIEVEIDGRIEMITFTIVEQMTPEVIGGIKLLKQFGVHLQWPVIQEKDIRQDHICNIEAQFGKPITSAERFQKTKETLKINDPLLVDIIKKNENVFMANKWDIGCTQLVKHRIETRGKPINIKPRRLPVNLEGKIDEAIQNLYENNIIKKCNSPWNTPLICVWKKEKDEIRLCLDFRQLNLVTERQAYPMPNITELLDKLKGARYFSSIDLGNAYYQVELDEDSKEKTAFSTTMGQYCFNRMPFGIAAAPGTFQELMGKVLGRMKNAVVYLDDILVFTETINQHYEALNEVLEKVAYAGLRINPEKCHVLKPEVKFLGHIINKEGVQTDPSKLEAIRSFKKPNCVKTLRSFLGICNYYRRFILGYAKKSRTLEELCGRNNNKLIWTDDCDRAFKDMKEALTSSPVLGFPDFEKEFILDTDASFDTIGAVLSQRDNNGYERVIAYGSHAMNNHEKGYCITRKELLAIYYFCQHFNHYLYGKRFTLRTDHKAITFMLSTKKPITTQFQTWINYLSSLDIKLEYRKGINHTNADMLSRNTCGTCTQCLMAHEDAKVEKMKTRRINAVDRIEQHEWQKDSTEIVRIKEEITRGASWKFKLLNGIVKTKIGKIWIPKDRKADMITSMHKLLSHAGAEKITKYISDHYDMCDIKESVKEIIRKCESCQRTKVMTTRTKEETVKLTANEPLEKIYIDICGPLQETFGKKRYIIGIIDQFSRYISLTAVARQDEDTMRETILNKWILRFGAPREIHVDCGKVFESNMIKDFARSMGILLCFSSPYHHNTNGIIERQFRTVRDYINSSLRDRKRSTWAEILPEIEFTLNATVQKSIGCSPAEVIFGRKICRERWYSKEHLQQRIDESEETQEVHETRRTFNVGEKVLIKVEARTKDKDRYEGPYNVIEKIHDRRYLLRDENGKTIQRNSEKMRKFFKEGGCKDSCFNS